VHCFTQTSNYIVFRWEMVNGKWFFGNVPVVGKLFGKIVRKQRTSTTSFKQRYVVNPVSSSFISPIKQCFLNDFKIWALETSYEWKAGTEWCFARCIVKIIQGAVAFITRFELTCGSIAVTWYSLGRFLMCCFKTECVKPKHMIQSCTWCHIFRPVGINKCTFDWHNEWCNKYINNTLTVAKLCGLSEMPVWLIRKVVNFQKVENALLSQNKFRWYGCPNWSMCPFCPQVNSVLW